MWHDAEDFAVKEHIDSVLNYMLNKTEYDEWCLDAMIGIDDVDETVYTQYKAYYFSPSCCGGIDISRRPGGAVLKNVTNEEVAREWVDSY